MPGCIPTSRRVDPGQISPGASTHQNLSPFPRTPSLLPRRRKKHQRMLEQMYHRIPCGVLQEWESQAACSAPGLAGRTQPPQGLPWEKTPLGHHAWKVLEPLEHPQPCLSPRGPFPALAQAAGSRNHSRGAGRTTGAMALPAWCGQPRRGCSSRRTGRPAFTPL